MVKIDFFDERAYKNNQQTGEKRQERILQVSHKVLNMALDCKRLFVSHITHQ